MSSIDALLKTSGIPQGEKPGTGANGGKKFYLPAGQLYATHEPTEIVTILGSCVSVCLFDSARRIGGVNHFLLPIAGPTVNPRYAGHAIDLLLQQLVALGAARARIEAKVFGGASVLKFGAESPNDLGARNVEAARTKLAHERIPVVGEDVGGARGRKLVFLTADGTALIRQV